MNKHTRRGQAPSFARLGLSRAALDAVAELGFEKPTPVQEQAIPAVLAGRDVLAGAQTGTGKTAAFLLPVLDAQTPGRGACAPGILVLAPTRELATQIGEVARVVASHRGHRVVVVVGGLAYEPQRAELTRGCDVLVATPGRLLDLVEQGACDLASVRVLVLDEADRMLDMGFLPQVRRIERMAAARRQTLLFSATLTDGVCTSLGSLVHDPVRVSIAPAASTAQTVEQYVLGVAPDAKKRVLVQVLRSRGPERVLVFVRGKHRADHLSRTLRNKGFSCLPMHGNRTQSQRARALASFAAGEVDVLVATDVLSRGIDVAEVSYVVNMDVPHESQDYVHRIGRTGRAGQAGWSLTLCSEAEYKDLRAIERLTGEVMRTYPQAEELDRGEDPFEPDPTRSVPARRGAPAGDAASRGDGKTNTGGTSTRRRSRRGRRRKGE